MPEWLRLLGILIVVLGLAFRLRTTLVVVTAALVTGLLAGLPLFSREGQEGIIDMLGRAFVDFRLMTLFILTLPAIGLAERYGLQEQSAALIRRIRAATVGRLAIVYQLFRILHGILGLRLNGHPSFVRPLIFPMAVGAAEARAGAKSVEEIPVERIEEIKAATSAAENYGNFYGQNLSPVQAGVVLVFGVLAGLGYTVNIWRLVLFTIPIVVFSVLLAVIQFHLLDRRYRREAPEKRTEEEAVMK